MAGWEKLEDLQAIFERGYASIGYDSLGDRGFRFMSSPIETLRSDRMIMSINPAGETRDLKNDALCTPPGTSAYVHEQWGNDPVGCSKLQLQYQAIFKLLAWNPLDVLQVPFSPFRHPQWTKIPPSVLKPTIEFCLSNIWQPYFAGHCPSEIITVGKAPSTFLIDVIPSKVVSREAVSTGWNNRACDTANVYQFENGTRLVQIPHLSRFGIMTAIPCQPHLKRIFAALVPKN